MKNGYKKIPHYWWDFNRDTDQILVESDHPKFPVVGRFIIEGDSAEKEIDQELIDNGFNDYYFESE